MSNTKIRVSSSQSKHKIYIGNLPRAWTKEKLTDELNKNVKGNDGWTSMHDTFLPQRLTI